MISKLIMVGIGGGYGALIRLIITNHCKKKLQGRVSSLLDMDHKYIRNMDYGNFYKSKYG